MSDGLDGANGAGTPGASERGATTAGGMLREARQAQGMHIAALAATIKVAQRKLEALEADRYDELPDATFTRALAQTVCRALKIDAEPVLARLPQSAGQRLENVSTGLNTPLRHRTVRRDSGERFGLNRPVVWATLVLLVAAVIVFLMPPNWWPFHAASESGASGTHGAATTVVTPPSVVGTRPAASPSAASAPAAAASTATAPAAHAMAPVAAPAPAAPAASAGTAATSGDGLTIAATDGASWVSVRDAADRTLISRTLQAGEAVSLDGAAPLRVTLGDARVVHLRFRGLPVALPPNQTVARLELK